jgi:O-antigen/teichoic acid export membrane protein
MMFLISTIGITIAGFFATMFYAHRVGAEVLGMFFLFLSYFGILSLFSESGIGYAGVKRISEGKDPDAFYTACLVLRLIIYVLTIAVIIIFRDLFVDLNQSGFFWILIAVVGLDIINAQLGTSVGGCNRLGLAASTALINNLLRIGVQVILVYLGYRILGLVGGFIAGMIIQILLQSRFIDLHLRRFTWDHVRNIFTYAIWAFLTSSGNTVFEYVDILVIGYYMAVSDAGVYGICWTFSSCGIFITMALSSTLFVKVSRWNALGDTKAISLSLSRACTYSLMFSIPIFFGGLLLGGPLLYSLYGADFSLGAPALILLIGMRVVQSIQQIYFTYLMALDHAQEAFLVTGTMAVTNLLFDLLLVPALGIPGAALASLITVGISTVFAHYHLGRFTPITLDRASLQRIGIAALTMVVLLVALLRIIPISGALQPISLVGAGAAVYFGLLLAMDKGIRSSFWRIFEIEWNP